MTDPARTETEILPLLGRHVVAALDDDVLALSSLERLLRREPYGFRTTTRPPELLAWLAEGGLSLLLLDQRLPGVSGLEISRAAERLSPGIACLLLTGYAGQVRPETGCIRRTFGKPWDGAALRKEIRLLLRERDLLAGREA